MILTIRTIQAQPSIMHRVARVVQRKAFRMVIKVRLLFSCRDARFIREMTLRIVEGWVVEAIGLLKY